MSKMWKSILVACAALALAGTAIGIVAAQEGGDGSTATPTEDATRPADDYLNRLAGNLGVTRDVLDAAVQQTALDIVDQMLADGKIDEDKAAELRDRIESGDAPFFFGFRPGFKHGFHDGFGLGVRLEDLATFLNVDVTDITSGLRDGQSLAQIAVANGTSEDDLAAYLLDKVTTKVNDAVANGNLTQERADEILANAPDKIDELIHHEGLPFPPGPRGPHPFGGFDGFDGGDATPSDETTGITF